MTGDRPALWGLLLYLLVAATPTLLLWAAVRVIPAAFEAVDDRIRAHRRSRLAPGPPLEAVVARLRRLRRELRGGTAPTQVRRLAVTAAYDETLLDVCSAVGLDAPLRTAVGPERAFARLLTEAALEDAGIALDPPAGDAAAA